MSLTMAFINGILLVTLFGAAFGQVFQMRDDGIYRDDTLIFATPLDRSFMCYNGQSIYYTDQQNDYVSVLNNVAGDVGLVTETIITTFNSTAYLSNIDCCCNMVAYGVYLTGNDAYNIYYTMQGTDFMLFATIPGLLDAVITIDCSNMKLYVTAQSRIYIYDIIEGLPADSVTSLSVSLSNDPRCVAVYVDPDTGGTHLFSTYDGETVIQKTEINLITNLTSTQSTTISVEGIGTDLVVTCIAIGGSDLYIFGHDLSFRVTRGYLAPLNIQTVISNNAVSFIDTNYPNFVLESIRDKVNGISICVACTGACPGLDFPDVYCIVRYPLTARRTGPAIEVLGVSAQAIGPVVIERYARTGRWARGVLPNPLNIVEGTNGAVIWDGISASVPSFAKGRRFGIFDVVINPDNSLFRMERIACIATVKGGFQNQFYTYTKSIGDSVSMVATFDLKNQRFTPSLRWLHTPRTGLPIPVGACSGQLSCTMDPLTEADEGVYEVFRPRRYLRTWHPIFNLLVRQCQSDRYGPKCANQCKQTCVHGECDDVNGNCICYAGWNGLACDDACGAGLIGQKCGISCSALHTENSGCKNLSICLPGKGGCTCYSGLQPPDCSNECDAGWWGPDCLLPCTACNPRTGL